MEQVVREVKKRCCFSKFKICETPYRDVHTSTAVFSRKRRQRTKNFLIGWLMFP